MLKNFRKVAIFGMMIVTVLGMSSVVFAQETPSNPTNTGSITIEKNLKVINPTLTSVDGPGVTFNYAVASETPSADNGGTTVTDGTHTTTVLAGPADGISLSSNTIDFNVGTAVTAAASPGADNKKSISATGDITKFTSPGIYRYKLTETTTPADPSTIGVQNTNGTRYIDVYVINGTDGLEFSGFVMHDGTVSGGKPAQKKTFDDALFETVNIELTKSVTGNMGDKTHEFPFSGKVVDNGRYFYAAENVALPTTQIAGAAAGSSLSMSLKDGDKYYIAGLSHNALVSYTETNNTTNVYEVSITGVTGGDTYPATDVAANGNKTMSSTDVDNITSVTFVNNFDSVSPTLVVKRYAPGIVLILFAGFLFAFGMKRKKRA